MPTRPIRSPTGVLVVGQVVPEELAEDQPGRVLVQRADPRGTVEADHALPHVLPDDAEELLRQEGRALVAGIERHAEDVDHLRLQDRSGVLLEVVRRAADRVGVRHVVLGRERVSVGQRRVGGDRVQVGLDESRVRAVVAVPAAVEVREREVDAAGEAAEADARLAVVAGAARVVALPEQHGALLEVRGTAPGSSAEGSTHSTARSRAGSAPSRPGSSRLRGTAFEIGPTWSRRYSALNIQYGMRS